MKIQQGDYAIAARLPSSEEEKRNVLESHHKGIVEAAINTALECLANDLRAYNPHALKPSHIVLPFHQNIGAEYVPYHSNLYYVSTRIDTGYSSPGKLPAFSLSSTDLSAFEKAKQSLVQMIEQEPSTWPPPVPGKSWTQFDVPPIPYSAFASKAQDPIGWPFLNIVVDDKSINQQKVDSDRLNTSQMVFNCFTQMISQARYRNVNDKMSCVGIVSDGYKYLFVVTQLNTLNFENPQVRNGVWIYQDKIYPENWIDLPPVERKLNPNVLSVLLEHLS